MTYDPQNWYWLADDSRVYASERQVIVGTHDVGYLTFAATRSPTSWPRDDDGEQTDVALQEVLTPYGLWVDLTGYAADKRWRIETGGITVAGTSVRTDEKSQAKITGALQLLVADPTITSIDWEAQPGVWEALDAETMKTIGIAVGRHVQDCFTCLKAVQEEITAGTITTFEQIDAAGWPSNA